MKGFDGKIYLYICEKYSGHKSDNMNDVFLCYDPNLEEWTHKCCIISEGYSSKVILAATKNNIYALKTPCYMQGPTVHFYNVQQNEWQEAFNV